MLRMSFMKMEGDLRFMFECEFLFLSCFLFLNIMVCYYLRVKEELLKGMFVNMVVI